MKKLISLFLCIVLLPPWFMFVNAEDQEMTGSFVSGDYTYEILEDGTASILGYSGTDVELVVPEQLDDLEVSMIDRGAFANKEIVSVTIPDTIRIMRGNPFSGCKNLNSIIVSPDQPSFVVIDGVLFSKEEKRIICYPITLTAETYDIPEGIEVVGDLVFAFNENLVSVTIPDSVINVYGNPFYYCPNLKRILLSPDHENLALIDGVLFGKEDKSLIYFPLSYDKDTYEIPLGIMTIYPDAFVGSGLRSITIPESVQIINNEAFRACSNLEEIVIPNRVAIIGYYAFCYCRNLKRIVIPESVIFIGEGAFYGCDSLTIEVTRDSYAAQYCKEHKLSYTYPDANDWLNP